MLTADFDFALPPELIAQSPAPRRDGSRLLVLHRDDGRVEHRQFRDLLDFLRPGDVLVLNNSRVIPARLRGVNAKTGGAFEMLLLEENTTNDWWAMMKPGKKAQVGTQIQLRTPNSELRTFVATVIGTNDEGHRRLKFSGTPDIISELDALGEIPLPPYIRRDNSEGRVTRVPDSNSENGTRGTRPSETADDRERYQTVFAQPPGSVAAPTAGLHFTPALLEEIHARGVQVCFVTLHVGLGTFSSVHSETLAGHNMHEERYEVSAETARLVNEAKAAGRRIIAVGTTSVRVLESVALTNGAPVSDPACFSITPGSGRTKIFIYPPRTFKIVDALLTNFHLPCSTLLMLVSAFAAPGETRGREMILSAYAEAIRERYRFFSYGDAMLIV